MRALAVSYRRFVIPNTQITSIVGSLGKTTTTQMVRHTTMETPRRQSFGNHKSTLAENILRCRPWEQKQVLETAIGTPGTMASYMDMIKPNTTVVTSIASDHIQSMITLENTRHEKAFMVRALKPDGVAILNGDDPNVRWMATQTQAKVIYYGMDEGNDIRATEIELDWPCGTRFKLHLKDEIYPVTTQLLGRHNVYPALAAVAVGLSQGQSMEILLTKIQSFKAVPSRMELIHLSNGAHLIDDSYKSGRESYDAALDTFAALPASRLIFVMGKVEYTQEGLNFTLKELGVRAASCADIILFCGDNFKKFKSGFNRIKNPSCQLIDMGSRLEPVVDWLRVNLVSGDAVLIKSTGARRLERISLILQGTEVSCSLRECKLEISSCRFCPLISMPEKIFENAAIKNRIVP